MYKIIYSLFFLCLVSVSLTAQTAKDFTLTDIEGEEHNLYSVLAKNKAVVIDFSTTWCPPCWSFHESGVLKNLYKEMGPEGSDKVEIYFMECDLSTGLDCLKGEATCSNTMGDWVTGVKFPIFNLPNSTVPGNFGVTGYPTVAIVSAVGGEIIFNDQPTSLGEMKDLINAKGFLSEELDLKIVEFLPAPSVCEDVSASITVQNISVKSVTNPEVGLYINGDLKSTYTHEGDVGPGEKFVAEFSNIPVTEENNLLELKVLVDDADASNSVVSKEVQKKDTDTEVQVVIKKGSAKGLLKYKVYDTAGTEIFDSGFLNPSKTHKKTFNFEALGCANIQFLDELGSGIEGNDGLTLTNGAGEEVYKGSIKGKEVNFSLNVTMFVANEEVEFVDAIQVTPNPFTSSFEVQLESKSSMSVGAKLVNHSGKVVKTFNVGTIGVGKQSIKLDASDVPSGVYFLLLESNNEVSTHKVVKL